jgi:hypothetical protein
MIITPKIAILSKESLVGRDHHCCKTDSQYGVNGRERSDELLAFRRLPYIDRKTGVLDSRLI